MGGEREKKGTSAINQASTIGTHSTNRKKTW
jgi:hypothetical protein